VDRIEQLIVENMNLVPYFIHKFFPGLTKRFEWEDLVAEGYIGLVKAAQRFDPAKGCQFSTFAATCIWAAIHREFIRKRRFHKHMANFNTVSLDAPVNLSQWKEPEKGILDYKDMLGDLDTNLKSTEDRLFIEYMLDRLPEKQRKAIELYFGLNGQREHTQREIAHIIGVSQVQVSRLLNKGLQRLKEGDGEMTFEKGGWQWSYLESESPSGSRR